MALPKTYTIAYDSRAEKTLDKVDPNTRKLILAWIEKNLQGCSNPRAVGKPLKGSRKGQWRYRVGDWRILANIHDKEVIIYVFKIGNRKVLYEK
jgi:mRNA interferase RelE/StbE